MFCIKDPLSNYYFHEKRNIIIFDTEEKAYNFLLQFRNYSINRALKEGCDVFSILQKVSLLEIIPIDFDQKSCNTINFNNIKK